MCSTLYSTGSELPDLVCLQVKKMYRLSNMKYFLNYMEIYIFLFDNFVVWKVLCSKKTILFDTVFLLAYSLAAKLRDFTKSAASKWLDHFLQQTVLCVPVKRKVDQNTAKVFFFGIV